jgi:hypothetical protein
MKKGEMKKRRFRFLFWHPYSCAERIILAGGMIVSG